ncbi:MAG: PhnD/SsuA/transferrin family substrate-binding protein [Gammaproteobacteria bacterium]|nr:PhnD/SsuA/transferrin family substrate-binding protein [Gammaproteobacteria bacterium]
MISSNLWTAQRRGRRLAAVLLLVFALPLFATLALLSTTVHADDDTSRIYHLGIFPYMAPRQIIKYYGPIAADMEMALHRKVKLESQRSFSAFSQALSQHTYDIALIQPFDYPRAVDKDGYIPLARLSAPLVTQFYVRSDSPYHTLNDLRGTTLAMPPAKAANSRMALRALYDNQLIPGRDIEIRYFNSHDSCLQQVWVGNASACTTAAPPVKVFENRMQASLRPIYATPPIPHVLFVAEPRVPLDDRTRLQQLIIGWDKSEHGRTILSQLGFPAFVPVKADDYSIMHHYEPANVITSASAGDARDFVLGIFPYLSTRQLVKNFAPLLPAFTRAVEMPVHLRTATSFGSFSDNLAAGMYDIVLVQPFEFERAVSLGYMPLAGMKEPAYASFYVRKDSPYHDILDFKGKIIAMSPRESATSRLGLHALRKAGIDPRHDVVIKYVSTHDACLRQVQRKTAATCITSPIVLKMLPGDFADGLRKVGETEKMPGVVFLAHKRVPANLRQKLKQEILSWSQTKEGEKILASMQFGSFVPVNPSVYENLSETGQ